MVGADSGDEDEEGGVEGEAAGGEGEGEGEREVARISIWSFIPWPQCPGVPQMKYLFPGDDRMMEVVPSL